MNEDKEENIVKKVCKKLGLTYKQLGKKIGVSEGTIKRLATSDEITEQVNKSLEMILKIKELEDSAKDVEDFKKLLKKLTG